jgi:hypothetical protein
MVLQKDDGTMVVVILVITIDLITITADSIVKNVNVEVTLRVSTVVAILERALIEVHLAGVAVVGVVLDHLP